MMNHQGTVQLETKRLILRKFTLEDASSVYTNWASDPEVTKYLTWPTHISKEVSKGYMQYLQQEYLSDTTYQWAMEDKTTHELIGNISVVRINENVDSLELGWVIGAKYWGQGYTAEAALTLLEFFFNVVKANRIAARHDPNNPNSGKVMKKIGMKYEGTLRQSDKNNQGIVDCACYSILKSEYQPKGCD